MSLDVKVPAGQYSGAPRVSSIDLEFMTDADAAVLQQSPKGGRLILWATVAFFGAAFSWASYTELDEVTTGIGKVIPSRQLQVVQNLEGGILAEILVREGAIVDKGQVLLRIDDTRFSSSYRENRLQSWALKAKAARLRALAEASPFQPPQDVLYGQPGLVERELLLFEARQKELQSNLGILDQQASQRRQELAELRAKRAQLARSHELVLQELNLTKPLVREGAISAVEVLRLERQVNELDGELKATVLAIPRVESRLNEARRKTEETELKFRNEARDELNETVAELSRLSESNSALEDRVSRTQVRSPVRGTVKQLLINTVGGVIQPGMDLLEIVPLEDSLLVEAQIRPADIAFLKPGQQGTVKFTAYDFAIYGGLAADLEHISADTIMDERGDSYYLVRVRTNKNFLGGEDVPLPLIPGMMTEVDILTGKKTVLDYLLKPVRRASERALRER